MLHGWLADLVLLIHLAFVLFVGGGGLLVARWPGLAWVHLPAVAWGAGIELTGHVCPLTPLENRLRQMAGEAGYSGDFIGHYIVALIYPEGLTRPVQMALGGLALLINLCVYAWLWHRHRGPPRERARHR